ncbi:relaxin receptor 2-like [Saccostrea cucullata]|uniref:relaxin receptor 2-like n=1 Tax=Saccostrea cuccullata TaxID=36930 RepID=UPI002ED0A369
MCGLEQPNDTGMTWLLNKNERSLRWNRPPENASNSQLFISTLTTNLLRSVTTAPCLLLTYRSEGIELLLTTSTQNLTKLKESSEFRSVKVNIHPQPDNYKVFISPHIAASSQAGSSTVAAIKFMKIENEPCTDCFSCLDDRLCIREGFCDMVPDCPDNSDEENCALECYHGNEYKGFRTETKYLHQCMAELGRTCRFELSSKREPGCFVDSEFKWEECNVPKCDIGNLICDFEQDLCDWQQMKSGAKWNRQIAENTGEMFASAEKKERLSGNTEERAVLFSKPQPSSSEFGCITMTFSGKNFNLDVYITQGTARTLDRIIFQRQNVNSNLFATTSFQTPIDIPYMVIIVATFQANLTGIIRLGKISYENGICKDKGPCYKTQYQCDDGRCINAEQFCNKKNDCPNNEDENVCNYNNTQCVQMEKGCVLPCPHQCDCKGVVFKCQYPENVTREVRVLDLSSSNFNTTELKDFNYLLHLNLSGCSIEDSSLQHLGKQLQSHSLQTLDISFNRIRNLQQGTFEELSHILYLNVSHNQITDLQMDFLGVLPELRHLILRNSEIVMIHSKEIYSQFNSSLELLDLRNNKIKTIFPKALHWLSSLSNLLLSNNAITNTDDYFSRSMEMLVEVDLSFNSISNITDNMFSGLRRLGYLNLQNNQIQILNDFSFSTLASLQKLNLAFNKIHTINKMAFENMVSLTKLNLTGNQLRTLSPARFVALVKLQILDLSNNDMTALESNAFRRLEEVKYLYINKNNLQVSRAMFQGLCNLEWIWTDSYIICCAKPLSVAASKCISPRDRISTCEQLISVGFLAQMIWYVALFSFIGNLYVIYYRMRNTSKGRNNAHGILILNLSFSDLLMGVYLFIIAVADMKYRNEYGFNDSQWRSSTTCTVAGLLATVSCEASVLFVFLITLERFLALKYPFSTDFLKKKKHKSVISVIVWLMTIFLAAFPISVYPDFYSRSTVCISLPLTAERVAGWEYATFVFIGFNLMIFIAIVVGQILIFVEVKVIGSALQQDNRKREIAVLKSLSYVVLSDMCCWIPIILIGIMAYGGMEITFDVYAWVVVLVLPLNSALNPFIYTFIVIYRQKQESQRSQSISMDDKQNGRPLSRTQTISKDDRQNGQSLSRNSTSVSGRKF